MASMEERRASRLMPRGHCLQRAVGRFGDYQAIKWDAKNKVYLGASESRKDGQGRGADQTFCQGELTITCCIQGLL